MPKLRFCEQEVQFRGEVHDSLSDKPGHVSAPTGSDGQPRYFLPMEETGHYRSFEMVVYNRWGNVVWRQSCKGMNCPDYSDEAFWWDGRDMKGRPVSSGVYFWVVKATYDIMRPPLSMQGSVTVFR